ncbi:PepSY-associated TM helix domain-containing protein [Salegentibacter sp. F188]|uniref:PepSY-associated TM helix domain-containing protein n=1 Tax=Autumnicola patrickiae TaxID=3075591 RepID=A0ABU3E4J4_9FLAO|nr:PepSY-associated TM helix domain-containing protein [Salegentibacter sp. F188]MDT0690855.1 PepSY-associated TM helix domain-containing protein [Salegentibacter sp. F188]
MKKKKKYTFRKLMTDIHLWLGLGSGIILFLVCFSGTALVFEKEIKAIFAEDLKVKVQGDIIPVGSLAESLQSEGEVAGISISNNSNDPYQFRVKTSPEDRRGTTYFVNPYTGETLKAPESSLDGFFMSMFRLHRWLLLESSIGRPIVGVATIIFFFLAVSGIVIWFPKKWKWQNFKAGFKIKFSAKWKRVNHDLHNTLGFYSCIFLVIMILTGLCWSFEWYREAGSTVLGTKIFGNRGGPQIESQADFDPSEELTIAEIYKVASEELNYSGTTSISFPSSEKGVYQIRKTNNNNWSPVVSDQLVLDRDGEVLQKELFKEKPLNVQVASLIKPIHTGEIFGVFSKIIYFITCLIATSLPVTGTIIWLNKMKKK